VPEGTLPRRNSTCAVVGQTPLDLGRISSAGRACSKRRPKANHCSSRPRDATFPRYIIELYPVQASQLMLELRRSACRAWRLDGPR